MVRRRIPRLAWMDGYQRGWLRGDLLAGVTITAYLVPQVMAYAEVAGLPAVVGLWASVGALLAYAALGSSPQLSVGPESTTALLTATALGSLQIATPGRYADFASALCLVVAGLCLLGWAGRLAVLAELLSRPVLVGYMTGVAAIMIASQLGRLSGIREESDGFVAQISFVAGHADQVHVPTLVLGVVTLVLLVLGSVVFPRAPVALLGMLGAAAAVYLLDLKARDVAVIGEIPAGLPLPALPHVSVGEVVQLLPAALGVALVGYTDNILTGRAFAARRHASIDSKRELLALGAANLGSGLMHGFPVSSSGSRTAIGDAVGGRTQLTGLVTVGATVLAILTLRPVLALFPIPALGAVVIYAALRLIDIGEFRRLAAFRRSELLIALATTALVLVVGVLQGVLVAIGLSILDLLRRVAHPHDAIEGFVPDIAGMHDVDDYADATLVPGLLVYRYDSPLFFANAEDFLTRARAAVDESQGAVRWFLLNTEAIIEVDITAVDALETLRRELVDRGIVLALARVKQDLRNELAPTGLLESIGEDRVFPTLPTAVEAYRTWRTSVTLLPGSSHAPQGTEEGMAGSTSSVLEVHLEELGRHSWLTSLVNRVTGSHGSAQLRFVARAPRDDHRATDDTVVGATFPVMRAQDLEQVTEPNDSLETARQRLQELDGQLVSDGWRPVERPGHHWWSLTYTRES